MSGWPYIGAKARQWLKSLHWRQRKAVNLVYGQKLTGQAAAARLGVSERTVWNDIRRACEMFDLCQDDGGQDIHLNGQDITPLAAAILLRAWYDAVNLSGEIAREARRWLAEDPWAEDLMDLCNIPRDALLERLRDRVRVG